MIAPANCTEDKFYDPGLDYQKNQGGQNHPGLGLTTFLTVTADRAEQKELLKKKLKLKLCIVICSYT